MTLVKNFLVIKCKLHALADIAYAVGAVEELAQGGTAVELVLIANRT